MSCLQNINPVRAELVEAPSFFDEKKRKRASDKLRPNGRNQVRGL
jgi:hypothetical protein